MKYDGTCHCGAIGFTYEPSLEPHAWSVRACQCTFCRAHDALSASDPNGSLAFHASEPGLLQRYRFGLETADFLLCRRCGVYIGAVIASDNGRFGIINIRALNGEPADLPPSQPMNYSGEGTTGRIARREVRWTPVTELPG
jgi:hypothetical protein